MTVYGLGTDVVEIERFRRALSRHPRIRDRVFTAGERALADDRADGVPALAARFAGKEATMKALGVGIGSVAFADIEITAASGGPPAVVLTGRAEAIAAEQGVRSLLCSISHGEQVATATVLAMA